MRVEYQPSAQCLEEGKVRVCLLRLLEDVIVSHDVLVTLHEAVHRVLHLLHSEALIVVNGNGACQQLHLHQREFLYLFAVLAAADLILRGHRGVGCLEGYRLGGIYGDVDDTVCYAQTVELRRLAGLFAKGECTVLLQLHRVHAHRPVKAHVLQKEHGVLGFGNVTFQVKIPVCAGCHHEHQRHREQDV